MYKGERWECDTQAFKLGDGHLVCHHWDSIPAIWTTKAATKNKQEMQRTQSNLGIMREYVPMDDVGEEVVVLEPVVDSDLLVVNGQRARVDAPLVFLRRVRTELPRKDIQDLLAHPTALKIFRSVACKWFMSVFWEYSLALLAT